VGEKDRHSSSAIVCKAESPEVATARCKELQKQLVFGDHLSPEETHSEELLLAHNAVFAHTDYEPLTVIIIPHHFTYMAPTHVQQYCRIFYRFLTVLC